MFQLIEDYDINSMYPHTLTGERWDEIRNEYYRLKAEAKAKEVAIVTATQLPKTQEHFDETLFTL